MMLPYYHPTSVVVVDDNDLFLHTLDLRLPGDMAYLLHHDARAALERVNGGQTETSIAERCFFSTEGSSLWQQPIIQLDLGSIEREISNPKRFDRISVVIVDYAMPAMNGLEFCGAITDSNVKKILLTGVADEKLAVKAFNDGLIDRFLPKSGNSTLDLIVSFTRDLQRSYFFDQQRTFRDSLRTAAPQFFMDQAITRHFDGIRERYDIAEYYLVGDPTGYLMVSGDGQLFRLVILSESGQQAQVGFAEQFGAPRGVIDSLRARNAVGYFFDDPDTIVDSSLDWSDYLHSAHMVEGTQTWLTAVIPNPPIDIDFDPSSSYGAYLDRSDRLAFTRGSGSPEGTPPPRQREHGAH